MICPLPIDWLDRLQADEREALADDHLVACVSCRALVERLRRSALPNELSLVLPLADAVPWRDERGRTPQAGDIWLSAPTFDGATGSYHELDRLPLLLLDDGIEERGERWFDVVPLDTETEHAAELHLLLDAEDTSLRAALRARFDLQGPVGAGQLQGSAGSLSPSGEELVAAALLNAAPAARWGPPLEGPDDVRVIGDRTAPDVMRLLTAPYAAALAADELDEPLPFAELLTSWRRRTSQTSAAFSRRLATALGLEHHAARVKLRYADLENGTISASGMRPELRATLAETLGIRSEQLDRAVRGPGASAPTILRPAFARSAPDDSTQRRAHPSRATPQPMEEEVDDLFLGGGEDDA